MKQSMNNNEDEILTYCYNHDAKVQEIQIILEIASLSIEEEPIRDHLY